MKMRSRGFTLIEVMVALTIVALSLTAVAASMNQMIDAANAMREAAGAEATGALRGFLPQVQLASFFLRSDDALSSFGFKLQNRSVSQADGLVPRRAGAGDAADGARAPCLGATGYPAAGSFPPGSLGGLTCNRQPENLDPPSERCRAWCAVSRLPTVRVSS